MSKQIGKHFFVVSAVTACLLLHQITDKVPDPYLDEIFHVPQAQRYVSGDYTWDPKITTPPGLYILTEYVLKSVNLFANVEPSVAVLRGINTFGLAAVLPWVLYGLSKEQAHSISLFPVLYFFGFLFYTDIWSSIFILAALYFSRSQRHILAAITGFISVWFRQTNIIWLLEFMACALIDQLWTMWPDLTNTEKKRQISVLWRHIKAASFHDLVRLAAAVSWAYSLVAAAFGYFVYLNGGIVLGDKSNHMPSVHVAQLLYCTVFIAAFSWPLWLSIKTPLRFLNVIYQKPLVFCIVALSFFLIIKYTTIEHPFLLADNRHYTFYLWRRLIKVNDIARYLAIPVYYFSIWIILKSLGGSRTQNLLTILVFIGATATVLIPTPLIEFRYYIIPYLVWRVRIARPESARLIAEGIWYVVVNIIVFYIFLTMDFEWPSEPGKAQRFMW
ncbi:glycosyltransferase family 59 protein [Tortispora caseinolytica NRRL Y-17796]|uniref:Dol-P-Glc:Glc(2)Man(9)GlcNAc(2)-PP-Dol alpha-1,2-glucosyltransferase n=1 Tax=Tortispora caseinolytica NRRL Y-17796 TaxID=767744 RepID=A0A1E4TBP8_9ASCO|nr:glycosyltransferase family 59 protein [Tortispora caseinolytica NRRL Y-17796]